MKVYEILNQIKGTNASLEQIKEWSYMNRISPCILEDDLELDCEYPYPESLKKAQEKVCQDVENDCMKCLNTFFEMELLEDKT